LSNNVYLRLTGFSKLQNPVSLFEQYEEEVMREKSGLSYVELISIAVALSVAAVSVVPKLTQASRESKTCELIDGLHLMRSQLDLYRAQHENCLPPVDSFESFETNMTTKVGRYGPYIKKIPVNPFNNLNTVRFDGEPAGAGKAGWKLDTKTGLFRTDNSAAHAAL
jgi:general secretion pathway protein G